MNPANEVRTEGIVNRPVPRQSRHVGEDRRSDAHLEMGLSPLAVTRMAAVLFAVVDHFQLSRREGVVEGFRNFIADRHFLRSPPVRAPFGRLDYRVRVGKNPDGAQIS
ncbi:hypothetical protein SAMN04488094_102406 [Tropicimonas isoalkanivorans]|uniref:Uncharacterized protein n=1 Tax=Tropicimonas isoalkanivorans TaxID=441112 RepID=A0A1I1G3U4_9RHOB|nr:hypothetical protein SAMN04488094_102406 [Tropicimonas isoalkanivorans]